jgi:para-aminobenzoate synthetase component 1
VGGGIVYDSDPENEYYETLHKGKTLMETLKGETDRDLIIESAWINGKIVPLDQASIKITDLGLQYGYGFFETLRVNQGKPKHLAAHITRFNRTWKKLFKRAVPDLSWRKIIEQVIGKNGLINEIAAVKIIATMGSREKAPFDNMIIVMAKPYVHRLAVKNIKGFKIAIYPHPRYTPLADHKTLNYLYYYMAGRWADEQGVDEALIVNPDGTLSETNSANILLLKGRNVIKPISPHVLPGIMEEKVCELLLSWGYKVERKRLLKEDLFSADKVLVTNSLIGAVPIIAIDSEDLKRSPDICKKINDILL